MSIHLSILLFMGNYVFLVHFNILVFKLVAEKDSETERPYIVCSPRLCLTLLHLSYRYYIKESKGSKRWLIFLEGELPVFGKLCVFWWSWLNDGNDFECWWSFSDDLYDYVIVCVCVFEQVAGTVLIKRAATVDMRRWDASWAPQNGRTQRQVRRHHADTRVHAHTRGRRNYHTQPVIIQYLTVRK